ncbi:M14 family zinc carboxypeptidase [Streptomyces sp. NPDC051018]|uniref:M14 family zinc carboxypeptidase n=1 Tax=Streptomyces sp. NPDC051018 TaxID=3365639 RepID=UPI0037965347
MSDTAAPGYPNGYPTTEQLTDHARALAARRPGIARLSSVGASRAGRPLWLLSLGHGTRHVLTVAGAHANEPVGGAACLRLADRLCSGDLLGARDISWHLLLCLDPDGAALNEPWPSERPSLREHYRGFFRPAAASQPEFPPEGGDRDSLMPESRALISLLDELRPRLQFSLHGHEVGGAFVQLTGPVPGAPDAFREAAAALDVPLEFRPYDGVDWIADSPGVLLLPEGSGTSERDPGGFSAQATWMYAMRHGTVSVVAEAPMWAAGAVSDPRPVTDPEREVATACELLLDRVEQVEKALGGLLPEGPGTAACPLAAAARELLDVCPAIAGTWHSLSPPRAAAAAMGTTAGNRASLGIAARRITLRAAAMSRRALAPGGPAQALAALDALLDGWSREFETAFSPRWLPVATQAELHVSTMLGITDRALGTGLLGDGP